MNLLHFLLTSFIVILIPHILISILFFSCFFQMSPFLFFLIKILGAGYLLYLGILFFKKPLTLSLSLESNEKSTFTLLRKGTLLNCFNPQLTLFFFSFLPQFTSPASPHYLMKCIMYGFIFLFMSLFIFILYGIISNTIRESFFLSHVKIYGVQKLLGLIFIFFSVQMAFSSI